MSGPKHNPFALPGTGATTSSSNNTGTQASPMDPFGSPSRRFASPASPFGNPSNPFATTPATTTATFNPFARKSVPFGTHNATDPFANWSKNSDAVAQNKDVSVKPIWGLPLSMIIRQAEPLRKDLPPLDVVAEGEANERALKLERELEKEKKKEDEDEESS